MLRIHFTPQDVARTRVATSVDPLWEIVLSLHVLREPPVAFHQWRAVARENILRRGLAKQIKHALMPIAPPASYFPDFLTPEEAHEGLDAGIEAVLSTSKQRVGQELGILRERVGLSNWTAALADGDRTAHATLGHSLRAYHGTVLAPYESVMNKAVAAERVQRGQALLAGGVDQLLAGMRPVLRWNFPVLEADYPAARDIYLDGRGLRLVPSFFCWKTPVALVDESLQPVLVYPIAHHSTSLYQDYAGAANPEALANLLGATRAAVLLAVGDGRTTTELAKAATVSAATVSHHTSVLRESGLIATRRNANTVVHTLTRRGMALLGQVSETA